MNKPQDWDAIGETVDVRVLHSALVNSLRLCHTLSHMELERLLPLDVAQQIYDLIEQTGPLLDEAISIFDTPPADWN
tara:strand:+ start:97 stop:327 length:231 start_codon:yes stop_codon:yes gene_type:complete